MSQDSLIDANRRLLLRNGAAIVLSGAAVALLAGRQALAQSASKGIPARRQQICIKPPRPGSRTSATLRLAYRRFGKRARLRWFAFSISPAQ